MPQAFPVRTIIHVPKGWRGRVTTNAPLSQNGSQMSLLQGIVSAYHLNEAAAGPFVDSAGGAPNLAAAGGVSSVPGLSGSTAIQFNGTTGVLTVADPPNLKFANTSWSVACWVYMTANPGAAVGVMSKGDGAGTYEYAIFIDPSGAARFETVTAGGTPAGTVSSPAIPLNQWVLITAWQDISNNSVNIAINANAPTSVVRVGVPFTAGGTFKLGNGYGGFWYPGRVEEVAFWRRVLSSGEIFNLYNYGVGNAYPY